MVPAGVKGVCGSVVDRTCGPRGLLVCVTADGAKDPAWTFQGRHVKKIPGVVDERFPSDYVLRVKKTPDIDPIML